MAEAFRLVNHIARRYAPWFREEGLLFQIEKKAFTPSLAFLPRPWRGLEIEGREAQRHPKNDRKQNFTPLPPKRRSGVLPRAGKIGAFFALVPPCLARDPKKSLKACHRFLRAEGRIAIGFIPRNSPWGQFCRRNKKRGSPFDRRVRFFSLEEVEQLLMGTGFSIQALFCTLFQPPGEVKTLEFPMKGYHPPAGFLVLIGEKVG